MLETVVDTDASEAREWAKSVYQRHRANARLVGKEDLSVSSDLPA